MMNRKDELEEENGYCDNMAASFSDFLSRVAEQMNECREWLFTAKLLTLLLLL